MGSVILTVYKKNNEPFPKQKKNNVIPYASIDGVSLECRKKILSVYDQNSPISRETKGRSTLKLPKSYFLQTQKASLPRKVLWPVLG